MIQRCILVLVLAGSSLTALASPSRAGENGGEPALRITWGAERLEVPRDEFAAWLLAWRGEYLAVDYALALRIERAAEKANVRITDAEVDAALDAEIQERVQGAFNGRREDWLAELAQVGRSEAGYRAARRAQVRDELFVLALAGEKRVHDPAALARAFELQFGRGGRRAELDVVRFGVVITAAETASQEERARLEERARRAAYESASTVVEQARGGADFADLARRFSDDEASRERGGRIEGLFEPRFWPEPALDALAALREGAISDPIFARGAWWVLRARRVVQTEVEDVRAELEEFLRRSRPTTDEVAAYAESLADAETILREPALSKLAGGPADEIVLRIGERAVSRAEFTAFALPARGEALLQNFLEHWWVGEKARRAGITVDAAAIETRIDEDLAQKVRDLYGGSRDKWLKELSTQGRTEDSYRREQRIKARVDLLADGALTLDRAWSEADLRSAWEARYGKDGRKLEVRMIAKRLELPVFETELSRERYEEIVRAKKNEVRAKLVELKRRATAGESFAALAKAESDDPETKALGGAFAGGWREARWTLELSKLVRELPIGRISEPLELPESLAIFVVEKEERVPFESVRAELERALRAERPTAAERAGWINLGLRELAVEPAPGLYR
ncbi:MAG: peptidylprolyl isomerase [Planctomycetes bacterium]|nr:peptidylprolyl isomerase [Planctomycetota bacterium]